MIFGKRALRPRSMSCMAGNRATSSTVLTLVTRRGLPNLLVVGRHSVNPEHRLARRGPGRAPAGAARAGRRAGDPDRRPPGHLELAGRRARPLGPGPGRRALRPVRRAFRTPRQVQARRRRRRPPGRLRGGLSGASTTLKPAAASDRAREKTILTRPEMLDGEPGPLGP